MSLLRGRFLFSLLGLIGFLGMGVTPAYANLELGTGLIRIDANWATVKTLPNGETVLTLNKEATGQWMGEVGQSLKPMVRNIDDRNVVQAWDKLGHSAGVGVESTLTWKSMENYQLVLLADPRITPGGHLRFVVESASELPVRMEQVSVNMSRADVPEGKGFPVVQRFNLTSTAIVQTTNSNAFMASLLFSNAGPNCYSVTLLQSAFEATLPANFVCGALTFVSGTLTMTLPMPSGPTGNVFFTTNMSVSGSPFSFSGIIAQWSQAGS